MISLVGRIFKKIITMNLFSEQKQTHRLREQTYGYQGWGGRVGGRGTDWKFRIDMYTLSYLK